MLLVADIGGTKTLLANYASDSDLKSKKNLQHIKSYKSSLYNNFEIILNDYLHGLSYPEKLTGIGLAVAGPVNNNYSKLTNLKWEISARSIYQELMTTSSKKTIIDLTAMNICVYNDLEAIAAAICYDLGELDIVQLNTASSNSSNQYATRAIVAPGTGLGMAYAVKVNNNYVPIASQGGHISYAPNSDIQVELLSYMQKNIASHRNSITGSSRQIGVEAVCSGIGIANIFRFFNENKGLEIEPIVGYQLQNSNDIVPVIISNANNNTCEVCVKTVELFIEILANAVQTMALISLSKDGIYLAGGIAVALQQYLQQPLFLDSFLNNSTMQELLSRMPIYLCKNKNIALIGASKLLNNKY